MIKKFLFGFIFFALAFLVGCEPTTEETEPQIDPSISASTQTLDLYLDEVKTITITVQGTSSEYEYVIADATIVSITGNEFTGLKKGSTIVEARLVDNPEVTISITVNVL